MPMEKGATILETLRRHGVSHASVCGGRGRCTTCRVSIVHGRQALPQPGSVEAKALARIDAPETLRLACQVRPRADLAVSPLLPTAASFDDGHRPGGLEGSERLVTSMFIDLRGSTRLGERKLPYDVLFVLNQFFSEMTEALAATGGHYAQFNGDGLMALYGLDGDDAARGCRQALGGAAEMLRRLAALNRHLGSELETELRMGIGIHFGEAIVGVMGPPYAQIKSAIGDNINIAARLESLSKEYGVPLVVSAETAEMAGVDLSAHERHSVAVKGRQQEVSFFALEAVPEMGR